MDKDKKINIYNIAEKAGVSIATVSRAMNPETRVRVAPATLKKIEKYVRQYGYTPNQAAKNLAMTETKTIALVFPYLPGIFYSNYYSHILAGVSDTLRDSGYQFKLLLLKEEEGRWDRYDFQAGERVDALLLTHWFKYFQDASFFKTTKIPCVILNDIDPKLPVRFVGTDHQLGGRIAANYLYSLGHRRVAVMSGPSWSLDSRSRLQGFQAFFKENGCAIPADGIMEGDFLESTAYAKTDELLQKVPEITAVFACNDQMAFGIIRRLKERGMACPDTISVMGFDDEIAAQSYDPALTTVHVPVYDMAVEGTRLLLDCLKNAVPAKEFCGVSTLPVRLVERKSTIKISV